MATLERTVERREFWNGPLRRVSWAGILGGAFVAVAVASVLGSLGVAIGAGVIDPAGEGSPSATAFGWGAAIWWIVSGMIAIFIGGLVAARLGGRSRGAEGPLHGIVTWAVVTLVTLFLVTSALGALIGGAFGILRTTASAAQQGAAVISEQVDISKAMKELDVSWDEVRNEARQLLGSEDKSAADQKATDEKAKKELEATRQEVRQEADREKLQGSGQEVDAAIENLYRAARDGVEPEDKQAVVDALVARTDMEREEAEERVDEWAEKLEKAWSETKDGMSKVESRATEVAQASAEGLSTAAWGMFIYLILTLIAGALGGLLGAPRRRESRAVTEERTVSPTRPPPTVS